MSARKPRGHLCQCSGDCHGRAPCESIIERHVYIPRHDPFTGERYPDAPPARLCGPCASRYLAEVAQ